MSSPARGRVKLHQCLGAGGFGEVYLATLVDEGEKRRVAVKILKKDLDARSQAVQRIRDEARLLHLLEHPNILAVYDLVQLQGRVALISEYVAGQDLEELLIPPERIPTAAGLEVLANVALALQAAYTSPGPRGEPLRLLHRDIKPGNIRIGRDGAVKVLDFGIAKASGVTREAQTMANAVVGSFAYMPPERFRPRQQGSPAGDVYAIGCVLYEILSGGHMLYGGMELNAIFSMAMAPRERMAHVGERLALLDAPREVVGLLLSVLQEEPERRPDLPGLHARLMQLAKTSPGPRLADWCREREWPAVTQERGELTGESFLTTSLGVGSRNAPAPPPPEVDSLKPDTRLGAAPTVELEPPKVAEQATVLRRLPGLGEARTVIRDTAPAGDLLTAATITPPGTTPRSGSGEHPVEPVSGRKGLPWLALALGAAALLVLTIAAGAAGASFFLVELDPTEAPVEVPEPVPEQPAPDPVAPEPVEPVPVDPIEPEPVVAPVPVDPKPVAPRPVVPRPGPVVKTAPEACADASVLTGPAAGGSLGGLERNCLSGVLRDASYPRDLRLELGRILVQDARVRCERGEDCAAFEREQLRYFKLDSTDVDQVLAFARYMHASAGSNVGRQRSARQWGERAWRRRQSGEAVEIWARSAHAVWSSTKSAGDATQAVEATRAWASWLEARGGASGYARELCASVGTGDCG